MPSSYSDLLRLEKQANGENDSTWGTQLNTVLEMIEDAIAGRAAVTHSDAASYTLTTANSATDEARNMLLNIGGTLTAARNTVVPTASKLYQVKNATVGGFATTVKTSAGTGISVPNGKSTLLICDGTNVVSAIDYLDSLAIGSTLAVTGVATFTAQPILSSLTASQAVFTDGSKGLVSNAITGTGNVVMSASPTLSGTVGGALTWSGLQTYSAGIALSGTASNLSIGSNYINNSGATTDEGISIAAGGAVTMSSTVSTTGQLQANKTASDTFSSTNAGFRVFDSTLGAGIWMQQKLSSPYTFQIQAADTTFISTFPLALNPLGGAVSVGGNLSVTGTASNSGGVVATSVNGMRRDVANSYLALTGGITPNSDGAAIYITGDTYSTASAVYLDANQTIWRNLPGSTERMVFDTSGNLKINGTGYYTPRLAVIAGNSQQGIEARSVSTGTYAVMANNSDTTGDNYFIYFGTEADGATQRGSITYNRGGGVVAYNTTSDYRSKDLFGVFTDSGSLIDSVTIHNGRMKGATQNRPMFVAHELQAAAPWAVTGAKDAVNDKGEPIMQQVDHQVLIPALWAEVKSLRARVASLEK